jgi:hypothetical protein
MLNKKDKTHFDVGGEYSDLNMRVETRSLIPLGAFVYDPTVGQFDLTQENIPLYSFVKANNNILNLNQSLLSTLETQSAQCGYTEVS